MRNLTWPSAAKITDWQLSVEAHTRGAPTREGVGTYARGSGARWVGSVSVAPMTLDDAATFRAFLHRLRGRGGSFLMYAPQIGTGAGSGTTTGAAAADAETFTLTSLTNSGYLVDGCWLSVTSTGQLLRAYDVTGSTVKFRPRLREALSGGASIAFGYVQGIFRLTEQTPAVPFLQAHCPGVVLDIEEHR